MGKAVISIAAAVLALLLLLPTAFGGVAPNDTDPPAVPVPEGHGGLSTAPGPHAPVRASSSMGAVAYAQESPPPSEEGTEEPATEEPSEGEESSIIEERTPIPTATAGPLEEQVAHIARRTGLNRVTFLGLTGEDWLNLAISLLIVLGAYVLASGLLWGPVRKYVERTGYTFDDRVLSEVGPHVRWLFVILCMSFATVRLDFVSADVKQVLNDIYFLAGAILVLVIGFRVINLSFHEYREHVVPEEDLERLDPVLTLLRRIAVAVGALVGVIVILSHFGINVTALTATLGLAGLALSLAAQDTLADAISGFIILMDQPFRVGDRIQIAQENTWGDVVEIGARTTRIRTRDNRLVIVPNSTIGKSQIVNYTYPDPQYRVETHLDIAYGTDIEEVRRLIIDTVRHVPGVLRDRPIDALYNELGDSAMIFRVRWWIESYVDTRRVYDRVHTALQNALDEAGIEMPYPTSAVNLRLEPEVSDRLDETTQVKRPQP